MEGRFNNQRASSFDQTIDKEHGRLEIRHCQVINDLTFLDNKGQWAGIKSIVRITAKRNTGKKEHTEVRYYISSLLEDAAAFNKYIRQHWGVENKLHWTLDVVFDEDRQRKRTKNAAQNFSFIRKIALNLLKKDGSKGSLVTKRLQAGWDNSFLLSLINQN